MQFRFDTVSNVCAEQIKRNIASAKARGLNRPERKDRPPLAVVGGGPSVVQKVDKLKQWKGDIWACGSAYSWVREQGIKAIFFNIDALPEQASYVRGDEHAILASNSDPSVFDAVGSAECFDLIQSEDYTNHGGTAVTATPVLALEMGYTAVIYVGCESSFDETTHAYEYRERDGKFIWVRVGDVIYPTQPAFLIQAVDLAATIRACPKVFMEVSGGMLHALVENPEWDIVAVNSVMHDSISINVNGEVLDKAASVKALPILEMAL